MPDMRLPGLMAVKTFQMLTLFAVPQAPRSPYNYPVYPLLLSGPANSRVLLGEKVLLQGKRLIAPPNDQHGRVPQFSKTYLRIHKNKQAMKICRGFTFDLPQAARAPGYEPPCNTHLL